jgi:serine/threonine-protein kinase
MPFCRVCGAEYPTGTPYCVRDGQPLAAPNNTYAISETLATPTIPDSAPIHLATTGQALEMGVAVGEYRVTDQIGEGGMGVVYGGVHPLIGKKVAIKILRPEFASRPDVVARFVSEARAVNAIGSRHIVNIFSFGQLADGRHYYVMDRLNGRSFAQYLRAQKTREFAQLAPLFEDILTGLAAAHAAKIVHRDLKPDNIFVVEEAGTRPLAVLLDFGIAKLLALPEVSGPQTRTGAVLGTPYYMAPEQFRSSQVDARADLYAFGVILYEVFAGRVPFAADSYIDLVNKHLSEPPPRPPSFDKIPQRLERLIMRLLSKKPDERPQSAEAVMQEVAAIRRGETPTDERAKTAGARGARWPWAAAALVVAGGAAAVVFARGSGELPAPHTIVVHTQQPAPKPATETHPIAEPVRGSVLVHVKPAAQVSIDGQPAGSGADVTRDGLPPGHHLVEATHAGYKTASKEIDVVGGQRAEVQLELVRLQQKTTKASTTADDDSATLNPFKKGKK